MMHSVAVNEKIEELSTAAKSIKHKRIENAVEEILDALGLDLAMTVFEKLRHGLPKCT